MCVLEIYFYRPIHMHGADSTSAITNVFYRLLINFTAKFCVDQILVNDNFLNFLLFLFILF